jgi:membrane protein DedA with SNARE-associated domain
MHAFLNWLVDTVGTMGYPGIVFLMFVESSFIPFPSEVVIPPAGYLIAQSKMSWAGVITAGTVGSVLGALFNYALAVHLGRPFLFKYGKYVWLTEKHLRQGEAFFDKHGHISTFIGRLVIGVRQYISFPAGLCRMSIPKFCFYTALGASIWVSVLAYIGFFVGNNKEKIMEMSRQWSVFIIMACAFLLITYVMWHKRKSDREKAEGRDDKDARC